MATLTKTGLERIFNATDVDEEGHVTANRIFEVLEAFVNFDAIQSLTNTPPSTSDSDLGKKWRVDTSPTGAWAGQANKIAMWTTEGWMFFDRLAGWGPYRHVGASGPFYGWNGSTTDEFVTS